MAMSLAFTNLTRTPARTLDRAQQSTYRLSAGFILLAMAIASPIGFLVALPQEQFTFTTIVGFVVVVLDIFVALLLIPILRSGGTSLASCAVRCSSSQRILLWQQYAEARAVRPMEEQ